MKSISLQELNRFGKTNRSKENSQSKSEYLDKLNLSDLKYAIFVISNQTRNSFNKEQAQKELERLLANDKKISIFFHRLTIPEKKILQELRYRNKISFLDSLELLVKFGEFSTLPIFKLSNLGIIEKIEENSTLPNLNFNFKLRLSPLLNPEIIPSVPTKSSKSDEQNFNFGECLTLKQNLTHFVLQKQSLDDSKPIETFHRRIFENLISDSFSKDFIRFSQNPFSEIHKNCYRIWAKTFLPIYIPFYHPKDFESWSNLIFNSVKSVFSKKGELLLDEILEITEGFLVHFSDSFTMNNNFRINSKRVSFLTKIIVEDFVKLGFVKQTTNQKFAATNELFGSYPNYSVQNFSFIRDSIVKFEELSDFKTIFALNLFGDLFKENTYKINSKKILKLTEKGISLNLMENLLKDVFGEIPNLLFEEIERQKERTDSLRLSTNLLIYEIKNREIWISLKAKGFRCVKGKFVFVSEEESKNFELKYLRTFKVIDTKNQRPLEIHGNFAKLDKNKSDLRLEAILEKIAVPSNNNLDEYEFTKESILRGKDLGIKIDDIKYVNSKIAFGTLSSEFRKIFF